MPIGVVPPLQSSGKPYCFKAWELLSNMHNILFMWLFFDGFDMLWKFMWH